MTATERQQAALGLLADTVALASRLDDQVTATRLEVARSRLQNDSFGLVVVGLTGEGKSSLVNALIGDDLLPTGQESGTRHHVAISYAPREQARVHLIDRDEAVEIVTADLAEYVTESGNPGNARNVRGLSVGHPSDFLAGGVGIVDTPGSGTAGPPTLALTLAALPSADMAVFVTSAAAPLSHSELELLEEVRSRSETVTVALTKTDLHPNSHEILAANRASLEARPSLCDIPLVPVSAHLADRARAAMADGNTELAAAAMRRSNLAALLAHLRPDGERRSQLKCANAAGEALVALHHLASECSAREEEARGEPETVQRLERTHARLQDLASTSSRWRVDVDFALRTLGTDFDAQVERHVRALDTRYSEFIRDNDRDLIERIEADMTDSLAALWIDLTRYLDDWFVDTFQSIAKDFLETESIDLTFGSLELPDTLTDSLASSAIHASKAAKTTLGEKTMAAYPGVIAASLPSSMATLGLSAFGGAVSAALAPVLVGVGVVTGGVMITMRQRQTSTAATRRQATELTKSTLAEAKRTLSRQLSQESASIRRELEHEIGERIALRRQMTERSLKETRDLARADMEARRVRLDELRSLGQAIDAQIRRAEGLRAVPV